MMVVCSALRHRETGYVQNSCCRLGAADGAPTVCQQVAQDCLVWLAPHRCSCGGALCSRWTSVHGGRCAKHLPLPSVYLYVYLSVYLRWLDAGGRKYVLTHTLIITCCCECEVKGIQGLKFCFLMLILYPPTTPSVYL